MNPLIKAKLITETNTNSLVSGIAPTDQGSFSSAETWQSNGYKLRVIFNDAFI